MQLNINSIKQNLCRQMALVDLIERSQDKAKHIATNTAYYALWSNNSEMMKDLCFQNQVTQRLVDMLAKHRKEGVQC
jgi:hypothetical protein